MQKIKDLNVRVTTAKFLGKKHRDKPKDLKFYEKK